MPIDPAVPESTHANLAQAQRIANLERRIRNLEAQTQGFVSGGFPVVTALPPFGREGRAVVLHSDHKLYIDTGTAWVAQT